MKDYNPESVTGVIEIGRDLYTKSPDNLVALLDYLKNAHYDVEDTNSDNYSKKPSRKVQEKEGWALWYATLNEDVLQKKGKCGSCNSYIDTRGIETHEHKCEKCGDFTFLKFVPGAAVRFKFSDDKRGFSDLTLIVQSYDSENKELRFFKRFEDVPNKKSIPCNPDEILFSYKNLPAELRMFNDVFTEREIEDIPVLVTHYDNKSKYMDRKDKIDLCDVRGSKFNFQLVRLFNGKEYSELDKIPVPDSHLIYEAWHWSPLNPHPKLHERILRAAGLVSDCGYYYQDGRQAIYKENIMGMRKFVKNFTTIDVNSFDNMVAYAPLDGPGFIRTLAKFCHKNPVLEDRPNIGNTLVAMSKIFEGKSLSEKEIEAGKRGLREDEKGVEFFRAINRESAVKKVYEDLDNRRN